MFFQFVGISCRIFLSVSWMHGFYVTLVVFRFCVTVVCISSDVGLSEVSSDLQKSTADLKGEV